MQDRYAPSLRALHWLIAALVLCLIVAGFVLKFDLVPDSLHHKLAFLHISVGLTVLVLMVARLVLRLRNPAPALPEAVPARERQVARLSQGAMYALMLAMPVVGVIFIEAHGHAVTWFGLLTLPALVGEHHTIGKAFATLHLLGGIALVVLIAAHLAALVVNKRRGIALLPRMWG